MEENIQELKDLAVAHRAALEFDNCPNHEKADYIIENIFKHNKEDLIRILKQYEGWSPGNIEELVFIKIENL